MGYFTVRFISRLIFRTPGDFVIAPKDRSGTVVGKYFNLAIVAASLTSLQTGCGISSKPAPTFSAPGIPKMIDVTRSGVIGNGIALNTGALQKVIDACTQKGGGTLQFPPGQYLIGTIELKDNVILHLDEGATLLGSSDAEDYRNIDPFISGDGVRLGYGLIVAVGAKHVGIDGAGIIDGQGKRLADAQHTYNVRPFLTRWVGCSDVTLSGITERNPGAWTNHFFQCHNVAVRRLTIRSRAVHLPNNDGIDIDSCQGVRIDHCDIQSGDDAICLKATSAMPCRDISITGCTLDTRCSSIKMGTESLGDFEHIRVSHCTVLAAGFAGIGIYSVDGANLHDVAIWDMRIDHANAPINIRLGARLKTFRPGDRVRPPGRLHDILIRNLHATNSGKIGALISGIPGHVAEKIRLENIDIEVPGGGTADDALTLLPEKIAAYPEMNMFGGVFPAYGMYVRHARGIALHNVHILAKKSDARPCCLMIDSQDVEGASIGEVETLPTAEVTEPAVRHWQ